MIIICVMIVIMICDYSECDGIARFGGVGPRLNLVGAFAP